MENYLELLPQELINIISLYLDYTETSILEQEFRLLVNYQLLLYENYPAFSKIIKVLKENGIKWKNYPLDRAYGLITSVEKYIIFELTDSQIRPGVVLQISDGEDLRTDNISNFISFFIDAYPMIADMDNIISSYFMLTEKKEGDVIKHKVLFPDIRDGDAMLNSAYQDYPCYCNSLDTMIEHFNEFKDNTDSDSLIALYVIFIYVLDHLDTLDQYKDKIIKINPHQPVIYGTIVTYNEQFVNIKIVYQHIIQFIKGQERYQKKYQKK